MSAPSVELVIEELLLFARCSDGEDELRAALQTALAEVVRPFAARLGDRTLRIDALTVEATGDDAAGLARAIAEALHRHLDRGGQP